MTEAMAPAAVEPTVRDLDQLSYREKVRHWMRNDPWQPSGTRLRFNNPAVEPFRCVMSQGNITTMSLLVGRPCFGIPTAFLRYKDEMKLVKGRGMQPASRCGTCKLRDQCDRVVRNRVLASPGLKTAYDEWLLAEGPASFGKLNWQGSSAHRAWGRLCRAALDAPFTSSNDNEVVAHYRALDEARLATDRLRQQRSRERKRRGGTLDGGHFFDIQVAAAYRMEDLVEAVTDDASPNSVRQLPAKSLIEMMEVWVCREFLVAAKSKATAPAIARMIVSLGWSNESATFAALSTRIAKDLARIGRFEKLPWAGWVLLPPFDPALEFTC